MRGRGGHRATLPRCGTGQGLPDTVLRGETGRPASASLPAQFQELMVSRVSTSTQLPSRLPRFPHVTVLQIPDFPVSSVPRFSTYLTLIETQGSKKKMCLPSCRFSAREPRGAFHGHLQDLSQWPELLLMCCQSIKKQSEIIFGGDCFYFLKVVK